MITKIDQQQHLERVLELAIVANWADLMPRRADGSVHIESLFGANGELENLQIWTSKTPGYWLLACSYLMSASKSHEAGVHFDNGYQSDGLAHMLEKAMGNRDEFALLPHFGQRGLIQVTTPTEEARTTAAASFRDALDRNPAPAAPLPAAG